jgi:hypothetical protein
MMPLRRKAKKEILFRVACIPITIKASYITLVKALIFLGNQYVLIIKVLF